MSYKRKRFAELFWYKTYGFYRVDGNRVRKCDRKSDRKINFLKRFQRHDSKFLNYKKKFIKHNNSQNMQFKNYSSTKSKKNSY